MKFIKRNYINIMILINIIYIVLCSVLHSFGIVSIRYMSLGFIPVGIINIIVSFIYRFNNKIKIRNIDIVLLFIIAYGIISTIFAYSREVALYGFIYRYEGLFSLIYYLTTFHLCSFVVKKKEYIIYLLILFGAVYSGVGVLQKIGIAGPLNMLKKGTFYAPGFTNNPNFLSSFLVVCISYAIGLFVKEKDILIKIVLGISIYLIFIGMLTTDTVSGMLGLFVVLILLLINCIKNKQFISYGIIILLLFISFCMMSSAKLTKIDNKIINNLDDTNKIVSTGEIKDQYGTKRAFIWKRVIAEVPKHWSTGIGIDNVYYIYDGWPIIYKSRTGYDKVHNEYLQILITEGVFALGAYLVFYIFVIRKGIKNIKKNDKIYLLLPVVGYLVQAFFNISVIEVAPIFYISMGLLYSKE